MLYNEPLYFFEIWYVRSIYPPEYVGKVPHTCMLNTPGDMYCYKSYDITDLIVAVT